MDNYESRKRYGQTCGIQLQSSVHSIEVRSIYMFWLWTGDYGLPFFRKAELQEVSNLCQCFANC